MNRIFNVRFLTPPILTILFVFLFSPTYFIENISNNSADFKLLIGATTIIFSFGFLISSVTEFIVVLCKLRRPYKRNEIEKLNTKFNNWKVDFRNMNAQELASWMILDEVNEKDGDIRNQINKRWGMAMLNFNSIVAIVSAWVLIGIFSGYGLLTGPNHWRLDLLFSLIFTAVFWKNGKEAYCSVMKFDRILARQAKANHNTAKE